MNGQEKLDYLREKINPRCAFFVIMEDECEGATPISRLVVYPRGKWPYPPEHALSNVPVESHSADTCVTVQRMVDHYLKLDAANAAS